MKSPAPHPSRLTPDASLLTPPASLLTPHPSPLTPHPSPLTPPAIRVSNLGKEYLIGGRDRGRETFREMITSSLTAPFRRWRKLGGEVAPEERFWALKDVSFEVQPGEVVGIIGRNGAGKSTLLKILSRITEPTEGEVEIRGRVASLLEVGTGFHSELTGRENIYLNGAILGMSRREIDRKFEEMVDFAGVEKFIDTPVKRYSSGMYVRLAFAVAAHLDPEILVVDEVLAVGDIEFQKKCLGKMDDVAKSGRTILFVSHNMAAIRNLCTRLILLNSGRVQQIGETRTVIETYIRESSVRLDQPVKSFAVDDRKAFQILEVRLVDEHGEPRMTFDCDQAVIVDCAFRARESIPGLYGYATINRLDGTVVMESDSFDAPPNVLDALPPGDARFTIRIPPRTLGPADYQVYLNFTSPSHIAGFDVDSPGIVAQFRLDDSGTRRGNRRGGYFSTRLAWELRDRDRNRGWAA